MLVSAGQHDRVRAFVNRVRHIGHLGPGRDGVLNHGFQKVRGHDAAPPPLGAGVGDAALHIGQIGHVGFDAQIAARHHQAIGGLRNLLQIGNPLLILDLGQDAGPVGLLPKQGAQFLHIARLPHEGQGDEIHLLGQPERQIDAIFGGDGRQVDAGAGQVDMALAAEQAAIDHPAAKLLAVRLQHLEVDQAIVQGDAVADFHAVRKPLIVDLNGGAFHGLRISDAQGDHLPFFEVQRLVEIPGANLRPLGVEHDGDAARLLAVQGPHPADDLRGALMVGMGHVQAHDCPSRHRPCAPGWRNRKWPARSCR